MAELKVEIDGQMVALTDCYWRQTAPCGCTVSMVTTTDARGRVMATAEDAHKRLVPLKRERDDDNRRGFVWGLVTKERYHAEIAPQWECAQHKRAVS